MKTTKINALMYFSVLFMLTFSAYAQNNSVIEEVVVTSEKRSESLQDISQSVTALTEEELEVKNITDFVGLSAIAPGVTVAKNEGYKTIISIRGVGDETNQNAIAAPSVALHMDGIFIASKFSLRTDFIDLERIEVLRGPQGTLFGQNSTGGTINVISQKPTFDEVKGKADITLGNYDLTKVRAAVNVPVSDKVATRMSVVSTDRDGFSTNLLNGQDLDDANHVSFRSDWLFDISDSASLRVFGQYFDADNNGAAMKGLDDITPDPRELKQDSDSIYKLSSEVLAGILDVDFGFANLKVLASIQEDDIYVSRDNDRHNFGDVHASGPLEGLPYIAAEYRPETSIVDTKTLEFNLISNEPINDKIDWIVGALYFDHKIANSIYEVKDVNNVKVIYDENGDFSDDFDGQFKPYIHAEVCATKPFEGICFAAYDAELGFVSEAYPSRESLSVYGQATYNVQDNLRYIFGLRYTEDSFSSDVSNFFGLQPYLIEDDIDETTGKIAFEYDVDENTMVYASYTKGFKPGGSNLTFGWPEDDEQNFGAEPAPQLIFPLFDSEIINAFEVGLKTDFKEGRMRANISAFAYDYENLQFQSTDPDVYRGGVANIPESEMSGLELELIGILSDNLSMDLRLSFLDTEITSSYEALDNIKSELYFFGDEPARYALREDLKGNKLAKSPEFTANFGLQYNGQLQSGLPLRSTFELIYRGDFQQRVFNNPFVDNVDSYTIVNITNSIELNDTTGIDLLLLNIADEDGINSAMTDVFGVAGTGIELIPPRQLMFRLRKSF
jgi:iron complex outermembrane receptor protein